MKEMTVQAGEAGQRLEKYIRRILPNAGTSFLYRMLRKKNITLNGKKADGTEHVAAGDVVRFFFSDETFDKFAEKSTEQDEKVQGYRKAYDALSGIRVIFETEDVCVLDKPAGMLSQKAAADDLSVNEWFVGYLLHAGKIRAESLSSFTPSVANRLDRNTEGLLLAGKTLRGSRLLAQLLRERRIGKYYSMVIWGTLPGPCRRSAYLIKDEKTNTVRILQEKVTGASRIETAFTPLRTGRNGTCSLVRAELVTGKTHQLRAQLADMGHPIVGDPKYGDASRDASIAGLHIRRQLLICSEVVFPELPDYPELSGKEIRVPLPGIYERVLD